MRPITNVYRPMFRVQCVACNRWGDAHHMAAGEEPFTFYCLAHFPDPVRRPIELAYDDQFRALSVGEKHAVRMRSSAGEVSPLPDNVPRWRTSCHIRPGVYPVADHNVGHKEPEQMNARIYGETGSDIVAAIDPRTAYPVSRSGHILNPLDTFDGRPAPRWEVPGTRLAYLTSPYGRLEFAVGTSDDFYCFDWAALPAGPRGEFVVLHAVVNSETGGFIQTAPDGYQVLAANSIAERTAVVEAAAGMVEAAREWVACGDAVHDMRGWNQDPWYFVRAVARGMFPHLFVPYRGRPVTERQMRRGGRRVQKIIDDILGWG